MRRLVVVGEKGGSGRTTLALNLAAYLARTGRRVLVVDLDPRGDATRLLLDTLADATETVAELILDRSLEPSSLLRETRLDRVALLPASRALSELPLALAYDRERALRLDQRLEAFDGVFDLAIIDTPASPGLLVESALLCATDAAVVAATTPLGPEGALSATRSAALLWEAWGREEPSVSLVIANQYRASQSHVRALARLQDSLGDLVSPSVVPWDSELDEATSLGLSVFEHAPRSAAAAALRVVGEELSEKLWSPIDASAEAAPQMLDA